MEDTGYMARAAFIMDRMMHKIGLHGKSFIPLFESVSDVMYRPLWLPALWKAGGTGL